MECDHRDARTYLEPLRYDTQTLGERAELVVHLHTQGLKHLCRGMATPMTAHDFFDRARELKGLAKGKGFSFFDNDAGDAARGRFFSELAKQLGELFFAVVIHDVRGGQLCA